MRKRKTFCARLQSLYREMANELEEGSEIPNYMLDPRRGVRQGAVFIGKTPAFWL